MHEVTSQELERRERELLSQDAACSASTLGRLSHEEPDPYRTAFQCDRDRILHCKAFRRLSHKTQVFIGAQGDHYRTRLTHTLEVQQISRTIARERAFSPQWPKGVWPRSCPSAIASVRSSFKASAREMEREIWDTSRVCARRVR